MNKIFCSSLDLSLSSNCAAEKLFSNKNFSYFVLEKFFFSSKKFLLLIILSFKVLSEKLTNEENRSASFKTVLFFYDGVKEISTEGVLDGEITLEPRGDNGFGYDPIFIPNGYKETFGEMEPKLKMSIDHRFNAFIKLKEFFI